MIDELHTHVVTHMELAEEIRRKVHAEAESKGYFAKVPDKEKLLGFTAHDIIMAKVTTELVWERIKE